MQGKQWEGTRRIPHVAMRSAALFLSWLLFVVVLAAATPLSAATDEVPVPQTAAQEPAQAAGSTSSSAAHESVIRPAETKHPKTLARKLSETFLQDQKAIWTAPVRTTRQDLKWWLLFGGGTAAFIATDSRTSRTLPNTADQMAVSRAFSRIGATYSTLPVAGGLYLVGRIVDNPKARETGVLGAEALLDSYLVTAALKTVAGRQRPLEGDGNGQFWKGGRGFPSGHAMLSWSFASVIAHEYRAGKVVPTIAYGLSSIISASRFSARKHFASDIVAGGAMGWFIGRYVFQAHHAKEIHRRYENEPKTRFIPRLAPHYQPLTASYGLAMTWDR